MLFQRQDSNESYEAMRWHMVDRQIVARGVRDERVLEAMRQVPRHEFVDPHYWDVAYTDHPLPIAGGQTISQPYIVAYMSELLAVRASDRVLEIGTGCGYQTAILACLAAEVYSVEYLQELSAQAEERLKKYVNVHLKVGNGWEGWIEHAPYDRILVTCAADHIPEYLLNQLSEGGRVVIPMGENSQRLVIFTKRGEDYIQDDDIAVRFVPMVDSD
ncbi:protein-L-isoaspartate(D-aspartate) O-methyltransferase [Rubritalea squalenifaciens DSM 18772]|uniref:Protein-L-isoaspartate O-methyltransferase n=1 Tax=Rubritalea squalenifaciens DSM 18772 TaxID=1123071 RepID=A0A1M6EV62_9BACT|nr:protein-L-isoaspartate(D-aspartate) O-methyltransferase [Rubritalea squalenifaciens]SHI89279.1 protein-L-isoaspartate(D-aspartate) O-methyltransferase [Rubritalea squalenifaciens DSM 18772]